MDGDKINHASMSFSDVMRVAPGLEYHRRRRTQLRDQRFAQRLERLCELLRRRELLAHNAARGHRPNVRRSELVAIEVYHGTQRRRSSLGPVKAVARQ